MRAVQSVDYSKLIGGQPDDTAQMKVAFEDILDAAAAWAAGQLPLEEFAKVGDLPNDRSSREHRGRLRHRAFVTAEFGDPRRADLMNAITALVDASDPP